MTLAILGGMSWASTQEYYRLINLGVQAHHGRQNSAELLISSVNFQDIIDWQIKGQWNLAGDLLARKTQQLQCAGATAFLIASNTMHKVLNQVLANVQIPALDIFDGTAIAIRDKGFKHVGLLGTRYTMNDSFFRDEYAKRGIEIVTPNKADGVAINEVIFKELIHGIITEKSRGTLRDVSQRLMECGAEGIILGCTELPLLLKPSEEKIPMFDTTEIHVGMAIKWQTSLLV